MQLTIDTQKDSHAEIRKAIRMLMSLVGDKEVYTNEAPKDSIFGEDKSPAANAFADMFGSSPKKDDGFSELNIPEEEKKEKEEKAKGIEFY
ncbi:hypothetical protein JW851_02445 [Candidatus Woesearchaeota archaeon]|nr:hypothetical protein [Candidatus Woesearchaeota archaeon]